MQTSVFLSNREVVAAEGVRRSGTVTIHRIVRAAAPENSIINGIVTDEQEFDRFFRRFWEEHGLPRNHVVLVLGNAQAAMRNLKLPPMSHSHRMRHLAYEFADVARARQSVISYVKMKKDGSSETILASKTEWEFLDKHICRFTDMGIRLESVVLAETADILALHQVEDILGKVCIVQVPDGISMLNILYGNGHYMQMKRTRMLSRPGTESYAAECACLVSSMCQFAAENMPESPVTHVYLAGGFRMEEYEIYRRNMLQIDGSLTVEPLKVRQTDRIRFETERCCQAFSKSIAAVGGLFVSGRKNNLLYQYRLSLESAKRRTRRVRFLGRCLAVVGVPCMIAAGQWISLSRVRKLAENQQESMKYAEEMRLASVCEERKQEMEKMLVQIEEIQKINGKLLAVPSYTADVALAIAECADGLGKAELKHYCGFEWKKWGEAEKEGHGRTEENYGLVRVEICCTSPEQVHQFAERLEERTEVFAGAEYTGFVWDEKLGGWTAEIRVRLAGQGGVVWK